MNGMSVITVLPLTDGDVVASLETTYSKIDATEGHPMAGATGECAGTTHMKGPEVSGGGFCVFETGQGRVLTSFTAQGRDADGAMIGEWAVVDGTGSWEGAGGSGRFASLVDTETGKGQNTIEGTFELK